VNRATPWIAVIGIGEDGLDGLGRSARAVVETAAVLIGGSRHQSLVPDTAAERLTWSSPLSDTLDLIEARRGRRIVVLATGDPMCFGVGETLRARFGGDAIDVHPSPSAFALVCARLRWPRVETLTISLHGRPPATLRRAIQPGVRIVALSADAETPRRAAAMLTEMGFGPSHIWAFEHMGGAQERCVEAEAADWPDDVEVADFNTIAIACVAAAAREPLTATPGLPDTAFRHDGMLTKREIRALALARLAPVPGQTLWDVGAGCGSVSVEWIRAAGRGQAFAVEAEPARCALIAANAEALGAPEIRIIHGRAPGALEGLSTPDAVFVGGGLDDGDLLPACWAALQAGGRLVANAVSLEGSEALQRFGAAVNGDLVRLELSRVGPLGAHRVWRPALPVVQLAALKP
jgi:precorrin-6Y C5,15-methyltransferase (decarboxylating)